MDFNSFKIRFLEGLSTAELVELADRNGLDIPPGLERVFVIGELLELERRDGRRDADMAEGPAESGEFGGVPELPERYGASYVDVLVRDPLWVFAFWEINSRPRDAKEEDAAPEERFLRVVPLRGDGLAPDAEAALTVAVGADDRALYLGIPPDEGRVFRVDLCARRGNERFALASSRPFRLPRPVGEPRARFLDAPLAVLSGAAGFPLARSVERLPRRDRA